MKDKVFTCKSAEQVIRLILERAMRIEQRIAGMLELDDECSDEEARKNQKSR